MQIGEKMRLLRLSKNMTIKKLASKTGLSVGFISNVERDVNSPTISSLQKICRALDTELGDFFSNIKNSGHVLRKQNRQLLQADVEARFKIEIFSLPHKSLQPSCIEILPGGQYGDPSMCHEDEEICLVLEGSVHFWAGDEDYVLEEGDCIYVESLVPHWLRNEGQGAARTFWVTLNNNI